MKTVLFQNFLQLPRAFKAVVFAEIFSVLVLAMTLMQPAPAAAQSGNVYGTNQAQKYSSTEDALVVQVTLRQVETSYQARTIGAAAGAGLGALFGRSAANNTTATSLGALVGGLLGDRAAAMTLGAQAQEIVLQVFTPGKQPRIVTIVQPAPFDRIVAGESVYLINTAGALRVVRKLSMPVAYYR